MEHTRDTGERDESVFRLCNSAFSFPDVFCSRETIKIFMFSLSLRGFVGLPVSFLSYIVAFFSLFFVVVVSIGSGERQQSGRLARGFRRGSE